MWPDSDRTMQITEDPRPARRGAALRSHLPCIKPVPAPSSATLAAAAAAANNNYNKQHTVQRPTSPRLCPSVSGRAPCEKNKASTREQESKSI